MLLMLELRKVNKTLGGRQVLCDFDLSIPAGETFVIVGSSGMGKSVTLQHLMGLMQPDSGDVIIQGQNLRHLSRRQMEAIHSMCGVLFQSGALINWMSIFDNIALPLREKTTLDDEQIATAVRDKLALVHLEGAEKKMPSEISGGMRKRAGLARALIRDPSVLLCDEPTSGLDPVLSRQIDQLLGQLRHRLHITAVVVTHDLISAFAIADRIGMLHEGRLIEIAPPQQFAESRDPLVRQFVQAQFSGGVPSSLFSEKELVQV